jgi:hypothetical protein
VAYAQKIIFEEKQKAEQTLEMMNKIHQQVEISRGLKIPNWAYQDVLYMLIAHSISSFELLHRKLLPFEKMEIYDVFKRVGIKMGIYQLPENYKEWLDARELSLENNYEQTTYSRQLYNAYLVHLGRIRNFILIEVQKLLLPEKLKTLIFTKKINYIKALLSLYKKYKHIYPINQLRYVLLPTDYQKQLKNLVKN